MLYILLDANLSPETAAYLRREFSFDVKSLIEEGKANLEDEDVITWAMQEKRIMITMDLDFGEIYHERSNEISCGIIVLRLRDQRIEKVNQVLMKFFTDSTYENVFNGNTLVVLNEYTVRIVG